MDKLKFKSILKITIFGMLTTMIILAILFAAFAAVVLYSNISPSVITQASTILGAVSLFLASFITSRIAGKKGLLIGFTFGVVTSIFIIVSTFLTTSVLFSLGILTKTIIVTISSCLGGIFGVNSKN